MIDSIPSVDHDIQKYWVEYGRAKAMAGRVPEIQIATFREYFVIDEVGPWLLSIGNRYRVHDRLVSIPT